MNKELPRKHYHYTQGNRLCRDRRESHVQIEGGVSRYKGDAFLNFGGRYPKQVFTGFVPAQDFAAIGGQQFVQSLARNPVTLRED